MVKLNLMLNHPMNLKSNIKHLISVIFILFFLPSCNLNPTKHKYFANIEIEGDHSSSLIKKLKTIQKSDSGPRYTLLLDNIKISKKMKTYQSNGSVNSEILNLKFHLKILRNNNIVYNDFLYTSNYLKSFNSTLSDRDAYRITEENLYNDAMKKVINILRSIENNP